MEAGSSSPSSSSSVSTLTSSGGGSCDETVPAVEGSGAVKFLCSYGGKILPRPHDVRLRYVGGDTRVLAVDRAISFSAELAAKMAELPGWGVPVSVRCKIPTEDLDALVSVTSDGDLANVLAEYDVANRNRDSPLKVKAFLSPRQLQHHQPAAPTKAPATPPSSAATTEYSPFATSAAGRCARHCIPPQQSPCCAPASSSRLPTRPPTSMCCCGQPHLCYYRHGQYHHNPTRVIHGGAGGGPAAPTFYGYHNHRQQHPHLIYHGCHWH